MKNDNYHLYGTEMIQVVPVDTVLVAAWLGNGLETLK